jgi:Family of unknown function (DUF6134)
MTRCPALAWGLALAALACGSRATAQTEERQFTIYVDGKQAGQYRMAIEKQKDGTLNMTGRANVAVKIILRQYIYTFDGREVWKDGRLLRLQSTSNDDGKQFQVDAKAVDQGLQVTVNNATRQVRWDVWTTSYWQIPNPKAASQAVALLDADDGKTYNGSLRKVGAARVTVAGQPVDCDHYRVEGGPYPIDLWFDKTNRLVRQDFTDQGHRTVVELDRIQQR